MITKEARAYLNKRIENRREQIKLIEDNLIKSLKDDIALCKNLLYSKVGLDLEQLEKRTIKLNKYINSFLRLKGGLK